jgi:3-oxoacyl-[acyl-carrier-protein] synthase-3
MSCYIVGTGRAVPSRVVSNAELAPLLGVTGDWIELNSGIRERRWVNSDQSASCLAVEAVRCALDDAAIGADQVDYLVGSTLSPDYQVPGIAPLVQRRLEGCRHIPAVDVRVGCASILYSLQLGLALVESNEANIVVCFGAEAQSKGLEINPEAAELTMLFGDGAGAFVLSASRGWENQRTVLRLEDILISTDGSFAEDLIVRVPGTGNGRAWLEQEHLDAGLHRGRMNGRNVILHAVRKLSEAATEITRRNGACLDQIELLVPHQANLNLLKALAKKLSIPEERVIVNLDRLGNTSSASAFVALWQAHQARRLRPGSLLLILAFGAGFTWGAALCRAVE